MTQDPNIGIAGGWKRRDLSFLKQAGEPVKETRGMPPKAAAKKDQRPPVLQPKRCARGRRPVYADRFEVAVVMT
jgi:hypothetical protein